MLIAAILGLILIETFRLDAILREMKDDMFTVEECLQQ